MPAKARHLALASARWSRPWREPSPARLRDVLQYNLSSNTELKSVNNVSDILYLAVHPYMLMPKKVKHRKWWKGHHRVAVSSRGTTLSFGEYGLQVKEGKAWITSRQIEAVRRTLARVTKKGGKVWIRIFPDKPITRKGIEVPMGGGKGTVEYFVFPVEPGRILFEIAGTSREVARQALKLAGYKLPVKTKIIERE